VEVLANAAAIAASQPEANIFFYEPRVPQPAPFGDVVAQCATQRVELGGVADRFQKLGDEESEWRLLDVLAKGPPAIVVNLFDGWVRAREEGDVVLQEWPRLGVGNKTGKVFRCDAVELFDVVAEGFGIEDPFRNAAGRATQRRQSSGESFFW
jgi:hypothetical protein